MSKIWESYSDRQVTPAIEGLEVAGTKLKVMSTPQARNSTAYDGRPACAGNSTCVPICPIQAKYDATVHVQKALAAGAELRDRAVVTRIALAADGKTIGEVHYTDWDKQVHVVRGRVIVLAAHTIESAKLLLHSNIANSSGQVGRNLMDHPQGAGGCLSPEPLFPFRGPPTTSGIDVFRDGAFRKDHAAFRMSLGNDGWGQRIEAPVKTLQNFVDQQKLFGTKLRDALSDQLTRQFRISFSTELLPDPDNRVTLSSEVDELGIPKPSLAFAIPDYNVRAFDLARDVIGRIFQAIGGTAVRFSPEGRAFTGAGHILGTCRMGADASTSVVDANGRSHDHPNLFIIGSSVFPTGGTANPTLTAVALTLRANRAISRDLDQGAFTH
jgi:choline dehydrogenase-like flavoprotein